MSLTFLRLENAADFGVHSVDNHNDDDDGDVLIVELLGNETSGRH